MARTHRIARTRLFFSVSSFVGYCVSLSLRCSVTIWRKCSLASLKIVACLLALYNGWLPFPSLYFAGHVPSWKGRLLFLLLIVLPLLCVAAGTLETTERQHRKKRNEISASVSLSTPFSLHVTLYRAAATSISEKWCNSSLQGLRGDNIRWIISLFVYFFPPFWLEKRLFVLTSFLF